MIDEGTNGYGPYWENAEGTFPDNVIFVNMTRTWDGCTDKKRESQRYVDTFGKRCGGRGSTSPTTTPIGPNGSAKSITARTSFRSNTLSNITRVGMLKIITTLDTCCIKG